MLKILAEIEVNTKFSKYQNLYVVKIAIRKAMQIYMVLQTTLFENITQMIVSVSKWTQR